MGQLREFLAGRRLDPAEPGRPIGSIGVDAVHIALEVDNVYDATEEIRKQGGKILRDAGPMNAGTTIIAFVEDPDGYPIELIGKKS